MPPGLVNSEGTYRAFCRTPGWKCHQELKVFLEAMAYIQQTQDIVGILCGDGPQRPELEVLRHKLGLDKNVYFMGYLPPASVWGLMKKASAFLSRSVRMKDVQIQSWKRWHAAAACPFRYTSAS